VSIYLVQIILSAAGLYLWFDSRYWQKQANVLREELAQERADRTIKEGNGTEPLQQVCQLHIAEIKRLEAERDALREQVESVRVANSARARKGWATRKRAA
jgi:hypothetical protein